jgi:hypothetical protein
VSHGSIVRGESTDSNRIVRHAQRGVPGIQLTIWPTTCSGTVLNFLFSNAPLI